MDTQKTLEKIKNLKPAPEIQQKIFAAKRQTTSEDLLKELNTKFPINNLPTAEGIEFIPMPIFKNYLQTQETMLRTGIYIAIDWDKMEYFAMDLKLGKEYHYEQKTIKKK